MSKQEITKQIMERTKLLVQGLKNNRKKLVPVGMIVIPFLIIGSAILIPPLLAGEKTDYPDDAEHPPFHVTTAGESVKECDTCHSDIIDYDCVDCHDGSTSAPEPEDPYQGDSGYNITFPHHTGTLSCGLELCHNASATDARYVQVVDGTHDYCNTETCHNLTHSPPPSLFSGLLTKQSVVPVVFTLLTVPVVLIVVRRFL